MPSEHAVKLHNRVILGARNIKIAEKELLDDLREVDRTRSYLEYSCSSLWQYVKKYLGLTDDMTYYFVKVARVSEKVPELKKAIDEGKLSVRQAKEVASVITPETGKVWTEKAVQLSQRELQREVAQMKGAKEKPSKIKPISPSRSEIRCAVSVELEKKIARLRDVLSQKPGRACTLEEAMDAAVTLWLEREDPLEKAKRAKPPASSQVGKSIPASVKHEVIKRDEARCTYTDPLHGRCGASRHVHLHHIVPRSQGGGHTASNLRVLCSVHHARWHERSSIP